MSGVATKGPKFDLGRVLSTPGALSLADELRVPLPVLLHRHASGDWGDVDAHDKRANDDAVKSGGRLLSSYEFSGQKFWIITDGTTDACPACVGGIGECEPDKGEWHAGLHFRTDLEPRRLATTVLLPSEY